MGRNEWSLSKGIKLDSAVNSLQLTKDRKCIFATTTQSNVYQIDTSLSFKLLLQSPFCPISNIVFGKQYNHIFATLTSLNGILTVWDLSTYLSLGAIKNNANGTALTFCDDNKILTGFDNGTIVCNNIDFKYNGRDTKILWEINNAHRGKVNCLTVCQSTHNIL